VVGFPEKPYPGSDGIRCCPPGTHGTRRGPWDLSDKSIDRRNRYQRL